MTMELPSRIIKSASATVAVKREQLDVPGMSAVSKTLFLPLFFRANETLENGIISDLEAVRIVQELNYDNRNFRLDREMQLIIALRTSILDRLVKNYIVKSRIGGLEPVVVNLGAGLDTRCLRMPPAVWYTVDLKMPIELRKQYVTKGSAIDITDSILNEEWIKHIETKSNVLIVIEGVLMYLSKEQVKQVFNLLSKHFSGLTVLFDALALRYTAMSSHQSIDVDKAPFKWGLNDASELKEMIPSFDVVSETRYYDEYMRHASSLDKRYRMSRFDHTHKIYQLVINQ